MASRLASMVAGLPGFRVNRHGSRVADFLAQTVEFSTVQNLGRQIVRVDGDGFPITERPRNYHARMVRFITELDFMFLKLRLV